MHSDSDAGDAADNDLVPQANLPVGDRTEENRSEGRNFLAMLQLAPRTAAETATPRTATPTSTSASPTPSQNMAPVTVSKQPTPNTTSTAAVKVQVFLFKKISFCFIFNSCIYFFNFFRLKIAKLVVLPILKRIAAKQLKMCSPKMQVWLRTITV